jgi:hypothetical protein
MRKLHSVLAAMTLAVGVTACSDPLNVVNTNVPDTERVNARPADVEQLVSNTYSTVNQGTLGGGGGDPLQFQLQVLGLENYSGLSNFNMGPRGALPRGFVDNSRNNPGASAQYRDWRAMSSAARTAANGVARFTGEGKLTFGNAAQDERLRMFGFFTMGVAMGNMALVYDSGTVITERTKIDDIPPFVPYTVLMNAAMAQLDSALTTAPKASAAFPLPATWLSGNALTQADFVRLVRSYKARFRAGVARTPAERRAADWTQVIADAQNGITADFQLQFDPATSWTNAWTASHFQLGSWHMMHTLIIGMADVSGGFDAWLQQPVLDKIPFLIVTPDLRFPQGTTRAAQNLYSGAQASVPRDGLYLRNRTAGQDVFDGALGNSQYDHVRFQAFQNAGRRGLFPVMTKVEIDMLAAEGMLYAGNIAGAAALIDKSRVKSGLPALTGAVTSLTQPVPGGAQCVPRVPTSFTGPTICGNIFEALKWEKRIETAYAGYGMWYFDSRGWGDLPEGTVLSYPVPYQELDTRNQAIYNTGGKGAPTGAARGTYGY